MHARVSSEVELLPGNKLTSMEGEEAKQCYTTMKHLNIAWRRRRQLRRKAAHATSMVVKSTTHPNYCMATVTKATHANSDRSDDRLHILLQQRRCGVSRSCCAVSKRFIAVRCYHCAVSLHFLIFRCLSSSIWRRASLGNNSTLLA